MARGRCFAVAEEAAARAAPVLLTGAVRRERERAEPFVPVFAPVFVSLPEQGPARGPSVEAAFLPVAAGGCFAVAAAAALSFLLPVPDAQRLAAAGGPQEDLFQLSDRVAAGFFRAV